MAVLGTNLVGRRATITQSNSEKDQEFVGMSGEIVCVYDSPGKPHVVLLLANGKTIGGRPHDWLLIEPETP